MKTELIISDVLRASWKYTKSQIWILAGLFIGYMIIALIIGALFTPSNSSTIGIIITEIVSILIALTFTLGYVKNCFQTLDGEEPQFSAYVQEFHKIFTYLFTNIIVAVIVAIGLCLLVLPGIYLGIRLQFSLALIVEEDAGVIESLKKSWALTKGHMGSLILLLLTMICVLIVGAILLGIGIFVAIPLTYVMYCYSFRVLSSISEDSIEENESHILDSQSSSNTYKENESTF